MGLIKQICQHCKKELQPPYRMVLMMGSRGYRQYGVHPRCAEALGAPAPKAAAGGRQRAKARKMKAGLR